MKTKTNLFIITGLSLLSSLAISWNSSALSKDNLNIIYDETPTDSVSFKDIDMETGRYTNASAKYTSAYNFLSEAPENPSTVDNIALVAGAAVLVVALALVILYSNSRRGFSKKACFALVLAVLGIFGGAFALSRNDKIFADEHSVQTITIKDKAFYDALKFCLSDYDSTFSDKDFKYNDVNYDSDYYLCNHAGNEEIVFDDKLQTVSLDPDQVFILDMHNKGLSDISDLLNFRNLVGFLAYNNDISDSSILTVENFPNLHMSLDYNHLADVVDPDPVLDRYLLGTFMAQTIDINVSSDGDAEIPAIFHKAMGIIVNRVELSIGTYFDDTDLEIPVHIHNLELSEDMNTAHVINPGEKAYFSFSFDEVKAYINDYVYKNDYSHDPFCDGDLH